MQRRHIPKGASCPEIPVASWCGAAFGTWPHGLSPVCTTARFKHHSLWPVAGNVPKFQWPMHCRRLSRAGSKRSGRLRAAPTRGPAPPGTRCLCGPTRCGRWYPQMQCCALGRCVEPQQSHCQHCCLHPSKAGCHLRHEAVISLVDMCKRADTPCGARAWLPSWMRGSDLIGWCVSPS